MQSSTPITIGCSTPKVSDPSHVSEAYNLELE